MSILIQLATSAAISLTVIEVEVDSGAEVPVVSFDADVVVSGLFVTKVVVVSPPACTVKLFFWIYANSDRGTSCDVNKIVLFQLFVFQKNLPTYEG